METNTVVWGFGFPLLLALVGLGVGLAFAMTDSESTGFLVARACFSVAAFDVVALAIYWSISTDRPMPWSVVIPTIAAVIAVPILVLSLQWLGRIEVQLSTRLYSGNKPTPAIAPNCGVPATAFKVFVGRAIIWTNSMPLGLVMLANEQMLIIDQDSEKHRTHTMKTA